jgi:hypothetical protein
VSKRTRRGLLGVGAAAVAGVGVYTLSKETESNAEPEGNTQTEADMSETTTSKDVSRTSSEYPMFQYNAANTGTNPDETGPQTSISEQWVFETETGPTYSSAAVVNGTVYIGAPTPMCTRCRQMMAANDGLFKLIGRQARRQSLMTPSTSVPTLLVCTHYQLMTAPNNSLSRLRTI